MMTSRTFGNDTSTKITVSSIKILLNAKSQEIKNAECTFLKFSGWLTAYFIIEIPFRTSFSTWRCIISDAIYLTQMISSPLGFNKWKLTSMSAKFQIKKIRDIWSRPTMNEFMKTSEHCSVCRFKLPLNSDFKDAAKFIAAESAGNLKIKAFVVLILKIDSRLLFLIVVLL
jgi:hypothetical protein